MQNLILDIQRFAEVVSGTESADNLTINSDNTAAYGYGGNDTLYNYNHKGVTISGGNGGDSIFSGTYWSSDSADNSSIDGGAGHDDITSRGNNCVVNGGEGNDTIENSGRNTWIDGGDGNDKITSDGNNSTISGGNGDDNITNYRSNVWISGGAGKDYIYSSGNSNVSIIAGNDDDTIDLDGHSSNLSIIGGLGNDYIRLYSLYDSSVIIKYVSGDGDDTITNFNDNDTLQIAGTYTKSTDDDDVIIKVGNGSITLKDAVNKTINIVTISGGKPNEIINAPQLVSGKHDNIIVTGDNTKIYGNEGNDTIYNDDHNGVTISGDDGEDSIRSKYSDNVSIDSGAGHDFVSLDGSSATINGNSGNDTIGNHGNNAWLNGGSGHDYINSSGSNATINGGDGDDSIENWGNDALIICGTGNNYVDDVSGDNVSIIGGNGNDTIEIGGYNVSVVSGEGNDKIIMDWLYNSSAIVKYTSGDGNDTIKYFTDKDTLQIAGSYSTTIDDRDVIVNVGSGSIRLLDATDQTLNIVTIKGGSPTPTIPPDTTPASNDTITNYTSNTVVNGTSDDDKIFNATSGTYVTINASSGDDTIDNRGANSSIVGGAGKDSIYSSGNNVTLQGGAGNDTITKNVYSNNNIINFSSGDGTDVIYGYNATDTIKITGGTYTKTTVSNDVIIKIGNIGQIALKNAKGKTINIDGTPTPDKPVAVSIPSDAVTYNNHSYKLFNIGKTWEEAETYCENLGGHLVAINTSGEQSIIESMISNGAKNSYWLGGYKDDNNEWQWITNESFSYTNWDRGEPRNYLGQEDKLTIYRNSNPITHSVFGRWNDLAADGTCNNESFFGTNNIGFICEWDTIKSDNSTSVTLTNLDKTPYTAGSSIENIDASRRTTAIKIKGNSLDNSIIGGSGKDSLSGWDGDDTLNGGKGNDTLTGGNGNDVFIYASGQGNDVITDYKAGEDTIKITGKKITSTSVSGSDVILKVGTGSIKVKNGKGKSLSIYNNANSITNTIIPDPDGGGKYISNTTKNKTVNGTAYNDTIMTAANNVKVYAGAGNDSIYSGGSSSVKKVTVDGGTGSDTITNYADNVSINGGDGNDKISTYVGDYLTIKGGKGADTIDLGFSDYNVIQYASGEGNDIIYGYESSDTIQISGGSYTTTTSGQDVIIKVGSGKMTLKGAKGETINIDGNSGGGNSTETPKIPSGYKTVNVTGSYWYFNETSKVVLNGDGSGNKIDNNANNVIINGNAGNDTIDTWSSYNKVTISGGAGNDSIYCSSDKSSILGGDGNDYIDAYAASYTTINGGKGNDTIECGGNNVVQYSNGDGNDVYKWTDWSMNKIQINGSYSTLTSGDDFIIKVGSGKMTFKDAAYLADDIEITGTRNYIEEHWFTEDDNFTTSEVDSILDSNSNFISSDYNYDSISTLTKQLNQTLTTNSIKKSTK